MDNTIAVLLSAYNGSRFLYEQLDSIRKQESVSVKLIIRDDGSTDETYSKLLDYRASHSDMDITIIKGDNVGYVKSFFLLTKFALKQFPRINYFSFSDQDDVWLPDKLISALRQIGVDDFVPKLYCANALMTDHNLNEIGLFRDRCPVITPQTCLIQNVATGCTTLFNRKAAILFVNRQIDNIVVHDQYLYILCMLFGVVVYDHIPHMLYRQHGLNQVGKPTLVKRLSTSLVKLFSHSHSLEQRARQIYGEFTGELQGEALEAVKKIAFYRTSMRTVCSLLFDNNFRYDSKLSNLIFRLKIIIGRL